MNTAMKKIFQSALMLLCGICLFTACADDNDSNPTYMSPGSFILNEPSYASSNIDLAHSDQLNFSWQYPQFITENGILPLEVQYQLQFSKNGQFTTEFDATKEVNEQEADFFTYSSVFGADLQGTVNADDFARSLQQIAKYEEDDVPAVQQVWVRAIAENAKETMYSNVVTFNVVPFYYELRPAEPVLWYLVGATIGDGSWGNSADKVGTGLIPMFTKAGESYDKATGTGTITYTGYFAKDKGFKAIQIPGNWDIQFNFTKLGDAYPAGEFYGDKDDNIVATNGGYFTVEINTATEKMTITAAEEPKVYSQMALPGGYNEWNTGALMDPVETFDGAVNHMWRYDLSLNADTEFKFSDGSTWWGGDDFPYGYASTTGGNLKATVGNYLVLFNDITGAFTFIAK